MSSEGMSIFTRRIEDLCIEMEAGENVLCTEEEENHLRLHGLIRRVKPTDQVDSDIDFTISVKGKCLAKIALKEREKKEARQ